jgi:hypothetical protein
MGEEEKKALEPSQDAPDKELTFFLLDKLYAQLLECDRAWNRNVIFQLLGSFGLITFAVGVISVNQFGIGGFSFNIGPALLLIGGAVMVGLFTIHYYNLSFYRGSLRVQVTGMSQLLGLNPETSVGLHFLLASPDMAAAMLLPIAKSKMFGRINLIPIVTGGLFSAFLPLLAQAAAFWKLVVLYGWNWWDILAFVIIFGITASFFASDYVYYLRVFALPYMRSIWTKKGTAKVALVEVKEETH